MSEVSVLGYARPLVRKHRSLSNVPPNRSVNADAPRARLRPRTAPVTFVC